MSKIMATLVRGDTYNLVAARLGFKAGKPLEVTKEQKAHLERNAIDIVTVMDRGTQINEERQKFVFEEVMGSKPLPAEKTLPTEDALVDDDDGEDEDPAPTPKARSRARS